MSKYTIIQEISRELRRRIFESLNTAPDGELMSAETEITLSPPSDELTDSPRLSLYLYHIESDGHLRNQHHLADGQNGLRFPPVSVQLRYLITPLDEEEELNQLMLGRILHHFHDQPFLTSLKGTPLDNSHGGNSPELRISFESLSLEQVSQVWHALNTAYRLSVVYIVRIVTIDSAQGVTDAKRVVEKLTAVGFSP